jgi:tetratricopeptide (TPR) repeat protein
VDALVADIERYQRGYPVKARPPGLALRALKFLRRNRVGLAAAALAFVLLASGVAMVWRSALEAERQREIAVELARQTDLQRREAERQRSIAEQTAARESIALQAASRNAAAAQASLKEARARFSDVRALAATLLFKLEPEARKVPGNTAFRKQLIAESANYYENLSRSLKGGAGENEVWKEIANAWHRLGSIQGDQAATWNLGDPGGALLSYRRALAAQETRLRSRPSDTEILCDVEDARITVAAQLRQLGLRAESETLLQTSVRVLTGLQPNLRSDRVLQVLSRAYFYSDLRAYRKISEDLFSRHPDDLEILRNTALAYKYALGSDSLEDRLRYARRALEIDQRRAEKLPGDQTINLDISFDWSSIGTTLTQLGRHQEAVDAYRNSLEIRRRLAQADPSNIRFQERLAAGIFYLATSLIPGGNKDEIVTLAEQGQAILTSIRGKLPEQTETLLTVYSEALLARFVGTTQSLRCQHAAKALQLAARLPASDFLINQHLPALRQISAECAP